MALDRAGMAYSQHPYRARPGRASYGLEAADRLGLDPAAVLKTLLADVDGHLVVALAPVSCRLDLKALAAAVGGKRATMAEPAVAERSSGYVVGGISPIGQRRPLPTVVDRSATGLSTVYVSGGRRGLDLGLSPDDLVRLLDATVADVARE